MALTESSNGRTITVARGTEITVRLSGRSGVWAVPQSSDGSVVHRLSGRRGGDGGASASFLAQRSGTADLTSTAAPHCSGICPLLLRVWTVHIVVRA